MFFINFRIPFIRAISQYSMEIALFSLKNIARNWFYIILIFIYKDNKIWCISQNSQGWHIETEFLRIIKIFLTIGKERFRSNRLSNNGITYRAIGNSTCKQPIFDFLRHLFWILDNKLKCIIYLTYFNKNKKQYTIWSVYLFQKGCHINILKLLVSTIKKMRVRFDLV